MNPLIVKQTAILSAILGGILGLLTLIPFVRGFSFLFLLIGVAALVLIYMKKNDLIGIIDVKEGMAFGGIIGFVSFIAFSIVYIPLVTIIGDILSLFKINYTYLASGLTFFIQSGFFVLVLIIIFMGLLSALMNAFSGMVTAYMYEALTGIRKEDKQAEEAIDFEIRE